MRIKTQKNSKAPEGVVYLNYRTAKPTLPPASELPTLINSDSMSALLEGDKHSEPLYVVEAIDFPVKGSGGTYTKSFFNSFLNRLKAHPFGGNKLGHSYPEKNDFYTVGGKIQENSLNPETGTVYFKIYIPSEGYETSNSGFIRDLKAKNVHFSLVTYPEYETKMNEKGEVEQYFIGSIGSERNDAVPFESGAMKQRINEKDEKDEKEDEYEKAKKLILSGKVNYNDSIEGEAFINNDIVYRSALRRKASRANCHDIEKVKELLSLIDKQKNQTNKTNAKEHCMDKEEALKVLRGLYANGLVSMKEVADGIGSTAPKFIRTNADEKNAEVVEELMDKLGEEIESITKEVEKLLGLKDEFEQALAENSVIKEVGQAKIRNANGTEEDNPCFVHAMNVCRGKTGAALKNALASLQNDVVMQKLLASQADMKSDFNKVVSGGSSVVKNSGSAPLVREV